MKIATSRKKLIVLGVCLALVLPVGYMARKLMMGNVSSSWTAVEKQREQLRLAPTLYREALEAQRSSNPKKAVKLLKKLQKKCPGSREAAQGLAVMAEMVSKGQASADLLPQIYDWTMTVQNDKTASERMKVLPYLRDMDASRGWKLHWQLVMASANAKKNALGAFMTMVDAVQQVEGENSIPALLAKAIETPELKGINGKIVEMLIQRTELSKGAKASLIMAKKLAKEHSGMQGGALAFRYACDTIERLRGDAEVLSFLKECNKVKGDGLVQQAARARLAAHYIGQEDAETAVSMYCGNTKPGAVLTLSPKLLEGAINNVVKATGRNDVTAVSLLQALADRAVERKLYRVCGDLYERAGVRCHRPEVKGKEAETRFSESDVATFWQGYILWHRGEVDQGKKFYEQLLPKYDKGWQVGQMMFDITKQHLQQLRYEDAVSWGEKGTKVLPRNRAIAALHKKAKDAMTKDQTLAAQIIALRKEAQSKSGAPAKAKCLMKIAQAQLERKQDNDAISEFRQVWEKYPETSHAPKAMFSAAKILIARSGQKLAAKELLEGMVFKYPANELSAKAFALLKKMEGK